MARLASGNPRTFPESVSGGGIYKWKLDAPETDLAPNRVQYEFIIVA